jgi:hypothetical protein
VSLKNLKTTDVLRLFDVSLSYQNPEKNYRTNEFIVVLGLSALDVLREVLDEYPNANVTSLQHRGQRVLFTPQAEYSVSTISDESAE